MWPTPNASDNRDRGNMSDPAIQRRIAMGKQVGLTMAVKDKPGKGTLNPDWVEWLMGYPQGWTDISDSSENPASQE
jgi:DNA (cytosine-5)-methyltransferase 1